VAERARGAGLRSKAGDRLTLYTDVPASPAVDELPEVFATAYPQWCAYFNVPHEKAKAWRMSGFVMLDRQRYVRSGLLPADLPAFKNGYARGNELWMNEQPTDYYRRHLLLHEGTHGFMFAMLGSCGPGWYMEGMAELLATHSWQDGRIELGHFPKSRDEVPQLGRIKLVRDTVAAGRLPTVEQVMEIESMVFQENEAYAWCWALAAMLDGMPRYRERFRAMQADVAKPDFNRRFRERFVDDWQDVSDDWQNFANTLCHGHDLTRSSIEFAAGEPIKRAQLPVEVKSDRGWQSSHAHVEAGKRYRLKATGRYQVAAGPPGWWSEAGGVTIRYEEHRPLGVLLGVVRPDEPVGKSAFLDPIVVGLGTVLEPRVSGTLYFRVNDSPAELADNRGTLTVTIEEAGNDKE
jgi:hypothetical protein